MNIPVAPRTARRSAHVRRAAVPFIEPLEPRRLLSASYNVVDVVAALPAGTDQVTVRGINNAGLLLINAGRPETVGEAFRTYTYSVHRHRAYALPDVMFPEAINNRGQLATLAQVIGLDGQARDIGFQGSQRYGGDTIQSINDSGAAAGTEMGAFIEGHGWLTRPGYYDPATGQGTLLPLDKFPPITGTYSVLLNNSGLIACQGYLYDTRTGTATHLPAGDGYASALSNVFAVGTSGHGFYLYNRQDGTQTVIGPEAGVSDFVPSDVNDAGVVVGTVTFYHRVRNHTAKARGAAVYTAGHIYDLNALAHAPGKARLVHATGINEVGQIVVDDGTQTQTWLGNRHVFVLDPVAKL